MTLSKMMPDSQNDNERGGFPRISTMGLSGLLVTFADQLSESANRAALAFRAEVDRESVAGAEETAASLTSVFLRFDPAHFTHADLLERVGPILDGKDWYAADLPSGRRHWRIPTVFGAPAAPQLDEAAALAGLTAEEAIADLARRPLRVMTIGFAPGLPYLGTLPDRWDIPRQTNLTAKVPASAVVVAIRQLIIFSTVTPTGWRHIGQTCFRGFMPEAENPFILRSGDEVSFKPVSGETLDRMQSDPATNGGASFEVIR